MKSPARRYLRKPAPAVANIMEPLESRQLLSASHRAAAPAGAIITFSQAPAVVQAALTTLAANNNLAAPTSSQTVYLANKSGKELYTLDIVANGVDTKLTVDVTGTAFTAPTDASTTFGLVTNTAVTTEFTTIAGALGLTAPGSADAVTVTTASDGTLTFTMRLAGSTGRLGRVITLDANGNPVGNTMLPLSVFSSAISTALTNAAPTGATPLTSTSLVNVRTQNGVTTYSVTYHATGVTTTITVNSAGKLTNFPSTSIVQFSTIPQAARDELQSLATTAGYAGTIPDTQNVNAYDEANGNVIYTVRLQISNSTSGTTYSFTIQLSSDQAGNPTVPPNEFGPFGPGGPGGCGGGGGGNGTTGGPGGNRGSTGFNPFGFFFGRGPGR